MTIKVNFTSKVFRMFVWIITLIATSIFGTVIYLQKSIFDANNKVKQVQLQLDVIKAKEDIDNKLGQYAINAMYKTAAKDKLSDARKQVLARAIVRISNDVFENDDNRRAYIAVVAIESGFMKYAQSPTGPKGLTQVAKATFTEAMKDCGVVNLNEDDVWETDINLYAGACYFRKLLDITNGDPYMAIVMYNQGPNSDSAKSYEKHGSTDNIEALKYVFKFTYLKRVVTDKKENGKVFQSVSTTKTK